MRNNLILANEEKLMTKQNVLEILLFVNLSKISSIHFPNSVKLFPKFVYNFIIHFIKLTLLLFLFDNFVKMFPRLFFVLAIFIVHSAIFVADGNGNEECFAPSESLKPLIDDIKTEFVIEIKLEQSALADDECVSLVVCYPSFLNAQNKFKFARPQFNVDKMEEGHQAYKICAEHQKDNDSPFKWNKFKIDLCKMECDEHKCTLNILLQHPFAEGSLSLGHIPVNPTDKAERICGIQFWGKDSPYSKIIYPNETNWTDIPGPGQIPALYNGKHWMEKMEGFWAVGIDLYGIIMNKSNNAFLLLAQSSNNTGNLPLKIISAQKNVNFSECHEIKALNASLSPSIPASTFTSRSSPPILTTTESPIINFCSGNVEMDANNKAICDKSPFLYEKHMKYAPKRIAIMGTPNAKNLRQFRIDFICDGQSPPADCKSGEILFHFNPRFDYENTKNKVILSSRNEDGEWGSQKSLDEFPFAAGENFLLSFIANASKETDEGITVEIKSWGKLLGEYTYPNNKAGKKGPNAPNLGFQKLQIYGDLEEIISIYWK